VAKIPEEVAVVAILKEVVLVIPKHGSVHTAAKTITLL
jgi:hypothetical protein